jgi:nondiscriminating aspartyl-tRNA synthetase
VATVRRIWTIELPEHVGERVVLQGWLHRVRTLGALTFAVLRDGRGTAQAVIRDQAIRAAVNDLRLESAIELQGEVVASSQAPSGAEVVATALRVIAEAEDLPPFDLFRPDIRAGLATILDHAGLALRHERNRAALAITAGSADGFRRSLSEQGFTEVFTPKIVGGSTESGANVFRLDYYGRPAFLAQSPQFYKQMLVGVFERVFEVGPVFRAEPHDTGRHLSEYVSLDAEMAFISGPDEVMQTLRSTVAGMVENVAVRTRSAVQRLGVALPSVPDQIPAVHFADAQAMIEEASDEDLSSELDLAPAHERWLCEWSGREHGSEFVFVIGYPLAKRPFYTHPDPERPGFSLGFDLLFRGVEIVTGGQRLHRYADYVRALDQRGERAEELAGYLEVFRHGMPPHGGFAIGLERWVALLAGLPNIRQVTAFPRDTTRLRP